MLKKYPMQQKMVNVNAKNISLLALVIYEVVYVLLIRYSKTINHTGPSYLNAVVVASSEVFKLCLSFVLEIITTTTSNESNITTTTSNESNDESKTPGRQHISHLRRIFKSMLICNDKESVKLVVPALLYLVQNNLVFVALANLSVGMYQVTSQGKLLTSALLSAVILKKKSSCMQYISIALLGFGVAFIHLAEHSTKDETVPSTSSTNQNQTLGLIAVLICCLTSGFSGVYFEFILKKSPTQLSVHCRNFHLASWSFILAVIHIVFYDYSTIKEHGVFQGFDKIVVLVVIAQGMCGFVVSMTIKYADVILKGFAVSVAAVFSVLIAMPLFGETITPPFVGGAFMVGTAVKMYSYYEVKIEGSDDSETGTGEKDKEVELLLTEGEDESTSVA